MAELGKAYIEVRADLSKFPAELRAQLKKAFKEAMVGVEFKELGDKAEKAGEDAGTRAGKGFGKTGGKSLKKEAEKAGKGILGSLIKFFDSRRSSDTNSLFGSISSSISGGIADGLKQGQSFAQSVGQIGSKIGDIGGEVGSVAKIVGIALLIPIAVQLAGALVQLGAALFALPAALGVVAAAFIPLIIAFQGFGEAISAGFSGDINKFNEALKGLPKSMQSVVKEIVGLKSVFSGLKSNIQDAFFKPLVGVVGPALRSIISTVGPGLTKIAASLGHIGADLLKVFSSPENLRTYSALLASTQSIVQTMEPAIANLAQSLLNLIVPALPFLERGATAFQGLAAGVERFTANASKGGQITGWLSKAADALKGISVLAKEAGEFLITAFGGEIGDQGRKFIHDLGDEFKRLNEFLKSKEGQTTLHNLTSILRVFGNIVVWLVGLYPILSTAFNGTIDLLKFVLRGLQALGGGFVWLILKIADFVQWVSVGIGHGLAVAYRAVVGWVSSAGSAIGDFFTKDIPRWFGNVVDWFKALPGKILDALKSFREAGRNLIVDTLKGWYEGVLEQIGQIVGLFLALPYLVKTGWDKTITFIGDFFTAAWRFGVDAVTSAIHDVGAAIDAVPGLLAAAGTAIGNFFINLGTSIWTFLTVTIPAAIGLAMTAIGDFFVGLWNDVFVRSYDAVVAGVQKVIDFFTSIPSRIAALGPKVYAAAVSIGHRIADGLSEIGNFATDLGAKVLHALKTGINWVIDGINRGIKDVDDKLPVDLPRIPKLARGDVVNRPTLALVGEAGPEVVIPLTNAARAQQLAEQSGLVDLLKVGRQSGAVNVVVYLDPSGVIVPTVRTVVNGTLDQQGDELTYARTN